MPRSLETMQTDVQAIWQAGVDAVQGERLLPSVVQVDGHWLLAGDEEFDLRSIDRIVVVGGGKATGAMALGLETALGQAVMVQKKVRGWVNVPEGAKRRTSQITCSVVRPAGRNEPTAEAVTSTRRMLDLVASLGKRDLCIALLSGGGSALVSSPPEGVPLEEKIVIAQLLSERGADISELNAVRRELSEVKGGGLARQCNAGQLLGLVLSDVLGDHLQDIASGPTVDAPAQPHVALEVLRTCGLLDLKEIERSVAHLQMNRVDLSIKATHQVKNIVIGNLATAVDAAGMEAERRGYAHAMTAANKPEGDVQEVASRLAHQLKRMSTTSGPDCLIAGGEPTVRLVEKDVRGQGGRNQQLALEVLTRLDDCQGMAMLSGGTDGEDGPTDAAGATIDADVERSARKQSLDPQDFARNNNAYAFFEQSGGLFRTGSTGTNVGDIRVLVVAREELDR